MVRLQPSAVCCGCRGCVAVHADLLPCNHEGLAPRVLQLQQQLSSRMLAQVKDLAAQVLPLEMVALSTEPAPHADEALPPAETHQVR